MRDVQTPSPGAYFLREYFRSRDIQYVLCGSIYLYLPAGILLAQRMLFVRVYDRRVSYEFPIWRHIIEKLDTLRAARVHVCTYAACARAIVDREQFIGIFGRTRPR